MLLVHRNQDPEQAAGGLWPAELRRAGTLVDVARGDAVYLEGEEADGLYLLVAGGLKLLRRTAPRADFILELIWPGTLFGEEGTLAGRRRLTSACALIDSRLIHLTRAALGDLLRTSPTVGFDLLERMAKRQGAVFERMVELTWPRSADRIASAHERLHDLVVATANGGRVAVADVAAHALASAHAVRSHLAGTGQRDASGASEA
ncbi:MAG: Crp/Fnr family transcriptional regulator [Deltaproteobacteria bacterium]|jgi:CRP/FNR family cyclic AMP-dependent transcriptional regulator|nr:Crp/Fnr family transcriptional regulator [Deltaproteobacteria bacterium]